jgi:hypothetical protein
MESFFNLLSLGLFCGAFLTMVKIVRDAFPYLSEQDRTAIRAWSGNSNLRIDRPIRVAWDVHVREFPHSRMRKLFAALLLIAAVSVMAYPLWLALRPS